MQLLRSGILIAGLALVTAIGIGACSRGDGEGAAEQAGKKVDQAVQGAADAAGQAAAAAKQAATDAGDAAKQAGADAAGAVKDGAAATEQKLQ
jgi:hypothetical protein